MKKLFTNDNFFGAMVVFAVIGEILGYTLVFNMVALATVIHVMVSVVCVVALYTSYKNHSKNVMKAMMSALLMAQLLSAIDFISDPVSAGYIAYAVVFSVLSAFLFVDHIIINSVHHSSPAMVRLNQIIVIMLIILNTVWQCVALYALPIPVYIAAGVLDIFGFAGMMLSVICVESRLDAYRLDREAAGWTEEAGYPEGYVHEYEKN